MRIRILSDYDTMKIEVDRLTKKVYVDWYGDDVEIGHIDLSEGDYIDGEHWQSWMFYEYTHLRDYKAPEGRHSISDLLDESLAEKISDLASDKADDWFNGWVDGTFVGSPSKLLMGAELDHGGEDE